MGRVKTIHFFVIFAFVLTVISSVFAIAGSTIYGVVKDSQTLEPLPGANVYLEGTTYGAATDIKGRYLITNVPPGQYTLKVDYVGYERAEFKITVKSGVKLKKDILLKYRVIQGEEIVVTAQAEGQMAAINQQLTAKAIVNVVSSARIQEIPDDNAAESVGRLPGVSVIRSGGEGSKVVIRGLAPKYNSVKINGVKMAPTDYDDRSVDLSMISPYMLDGIEVIKAITPDMDADALGGSVNFKLREAPEGMKYDLIFQGGYNSLKNTYNDYKIVGNISNRFFNNKLGVFAQFDVEKRDRSSNIMGANYELNSPELGVKNEVDISGLTLTDITREKKRYGGTLVMDYHIPYGKLVFNNFFSSGRTRAQSRSQTFDVPFSYHDYITKDQENKLEVMVNALSYTQNLPWLNINAELSHSLSKQSSPKNLSFDFTENNALENFDRNISPYQIPDYAKNDLDNTVLANIDRFKESSKDEEYMAALNFSKNFHITDQLASIVKFGGKYGYKDREYDYDSYGGFLNYGSGQTARDAILDAFPWMKEQVESGSLNLPFPLFFDPDYHPDEFLKGKYPTWPAADIDLMYDVVDVLEGLGDTEAYRYRDMSSTLYDYSGNEYYKAGYFMTDFQYKNLIHFIGGVRYEEVTRKYTGVQGNSTIGIAEFDYHVDTVLTTEVTNHNLLPMFHLKIKPVDWFDIRLAYTNTLSRPDYVRIIPRLNIGTESVTLKNYKLKPSRSENYDVYLSFHQRNLGLFTIGGFKKDIDDMIFAINGRVILHPEEYGLTSKEKGKRLYTDENNPYPVKLWGIEVSWQTNFWYLPGLLKGIVLDVNYTHVNSEARYPRSILNREFDPATWQYHEWVVDTFYTARMLYQPDDVVNVSFGYDYKGFSGRVSLLYQSNIFKAVNFWPELREITDDYWRWDLSIKQRLPWPGLQLYLNVRNITGTIDRDIIVGSGYPSSEQYYGKGIDIGLRYRIN
ncbi:TonB-dependent receptor [Calditrichota bacterium LG25]